jgi:hypothetical protein
MLKAPPGWTADKLARFQTYMASPAPLFNPNDPRDADRILAPDVVPPPDLGHNGPPADESTDPGSDRAFRIELELPEEVRNRRDCKAFERALQDQGPYPDRLAAIEQSVARMRADKLVQHAEFRLYQGVADTAKGEHRCSILDLHKLGYVVGITDPSNLSKIAKRLEDSGRFAVLRYAEGELKDARSRKILLAPIVNAEDRAKATVPRILAEAQAAKVSELTKLAEVRRTRYHDNHDKQDNVVVPTTTTNCRGGNNHDNQSVVVVATFCRGDSNHTLIPHKNTTEEVGADAPHAPSQNKHGTTTQGTPSAASSFPPSPSAVSAGAHGSDHGEAGEGPRRGGKRGRAGDLGTFLPDDWELPSDWRERTRLKFGLSDAQIDHQATKFRNHWTEPTSKNRRKVKWEATWVNWILSSIERGLTPAGPTPPKTASPPAYDDLSNNLHRSRAFLKQLVLDPAKPWPASAPRADLFHPQALSEAGFPATKGASTT